MRDRKLWGAVTIIAVLFALVVGLALGWARFGPSVAQAQTDPETVSALPRTITVVGEGSVKIRPDTAQANIGVEVLNASVKEASSEANQIMDAVLDVLTEQGIDEKDIQTSAFSIWAERPYSPEGLQEGEVIYHVTNQVSVTIRDLDKVGTVLEAAIEAGANNIYGVNFSVAEPALLESEAREKAVADAQAKAQELADLNGVQVGDVVSVSEVIGGGGGYYTGGFREMPAALGLGGGGTSVSPGELELSLQLQVVYAVQ